MCGFAGFHAPRDFPESAATIVREMGDRLRHRGPDDAGEWLEPRLGTALAFRRLAILDRSELGHQPMVSANSRFTLAVNGEVYNYRALRAELEQQGHTFRGQTDTEVLLEGISAWGLEATLRRCVGMFALALVDVQARKLWLARDRLGEKPLYYGWSSGHFFFGSELKAFRPHPGFTPRVDLGALTLYLRYGYVPSPYCILTGFKKLPPACILTLALDGGAASGSEKLTRYWSIPEPEEEASFKGSPEDYVSGLEQLLRDTIRMQMLADVPVGAFLSGGVDSSTVVSLMQAQAAIPVKTFSIGFPDARLDESGYAARVAAHLGTDHTAWICADSELLGLVEQVPSVYCEPFADDSQLPTLALAKLARHQVTVSLSGDGGDELFHGYGGYARTLWRWQQIQRHRSIGIGFRCGLNTLSAVAALLPKSRLKRRLICKLGKGRNQWLSANLPAFYRHRSSVVKTPNLFLRHPEVMPDFFDDTGQSEALRDNVSWLSYLDLHTYLPDHILVKVDRAAMAFGLETRIPLLDHRIVEYAAKVSDGLMRRDGRAKWPLRQILAKYLPSNLIDRPKMGFCTPMNRWLRGPLRAWAEGLLAEDRLHREKLFNVEEVRRCWNQHLGGKHNHAPLLWNLLVFQAWHAAF